MNNSPATAFMKDESGRMIYVNKPYERVFHTSLEAVYGKNDFELWPLEVAEQLRAHDLEVLTSNKPLEVLEQAPTPSKGMREWLSFKFPITDAAGQRFLAEHGHRRHRAKAGRGAASRAAKARPGARPPRRHRSDHRQDRARPRKPALGSIDASAIGLAAGASRSDPTPRQRDQAGRAAGLRSASAGGADSRVPELRPRAASRSSADRAPALSSRGAQCLATGGERASDRSQARRDGIAKANRGGRREAPPRDGQPRSRTQSKRSSRDPAR